MTQDNSESRGEPTAPTKKRSISFVGVVLMLGSLPIWPLLLVVPFLPMSLEAQAITATTMIVVAEIAFWLGAVLAGPEAAKRVRSKWRSRKSKS
ncbi:MAG: transporter suffix domain-containing protein [Planctomycetota bacterium]